MKLNNFGLAIVEMEAARLAEATAAIEAGWTPETHTPEPATEPRTPKPARTLEEIERLRIKATNKAKWWADTARRTKAKIALAESNKPRFDHGMLNTPLRRRQSEADRTERLHLDHQYQLSRAAHLAQLATKYQRQIEKRTK